MKQQKLLDDSDIYELQVSQDRYESTISSIVDRVKLVYSRQTKITIHDTILSKMIWDSSGMMIICKLELPI